MLYSKKGKARPYFTTILKTQENSENSDANFVSSFLLFRKMWNYKRFVISWSFLFLFPVGVAECSRKSWRLCFKSFCWDPEVIKVRFRLLMSRCCGFMFSVRHIKWCETYGSLPVFQSCNHASAVDMFLTVSLFPVGSQQNAEVMHRLNIISKLLILLHDTSVTRKKVSVICTIIKSLLEEHFNTTDIKRHVC